MLIGRVALELGLPTHVLRHWEDVEVLVPGRDHAGQRVYDEEHLTRARLVLVCQGAGLTLGQIRDLMAAGTADRAALVAQHRADLARRMSELARGEAFLAHTLACRHPVVSECPECSGLASGLTARGGRTGSRARP